MISKGLGFQDHGNPPRTRGYSRQTVSRQQQVQASDCASVPGATSAEATESATSADNATSTTETAAAGGATSEGGGPDGGAAAEGDGSGVGWVEGAEDDEGWASDDEVPVQGGGEHSSQAAREAFHRLDDIHT
jgi:hypothetical protein